MVFLVNLGEEDERGENHRRKKKPNCLSLKWQKENNLAKGSKVSFERSLRRKAKKLLGNFET